MNNSRYDKFQKSKKLPLEDSKSHMKSMPKSLKHDYEIIKKRVSILITIIISATLIYIIYPKGEENNEKNNIEDLSSKAFIISQDFVKNRLKSPASAIFSNYNYNYKIIDSTKIQIKSCVDSQNSFGAMLRTYYSVTVGYNGGRWMNENNWTLYDIKFEEN